MALKIRDIEGYRATEVTGPVKISANGLTMTSLANEAQRPYAEFVAEKVETLNSKRRRSSRGGAVMAANAGPVVFRALTDALDLSNTDVLVALEEHPGRVDATARVAQELEVNPEGLILGEGSFLGASSKELQNLIPCSLDFLVLGLGLATENLATGLDEASRNMHLATIQASRLLRVGGSLVVGFRKRIAPLFETGLGGSFQLLDKDSQDLGDFRAMRAVLMM